MTLLWATLLPKAMDRGGGSTYSAGVRRLLESEFGGRFEEVFVLPIDPRRRKVKLLSALARSMISRQSAKLLYCRSTEAINRVRASDADLLVCDHVEAAYLMPYFRGRTCVVLHNVEGQLMVDRGARGGWLKRWFLTREGRRMTRFEAWALGRADDAISLSPEDMAAFAQLVPGKAIRHVPPMFDYCAPLRKPPARPPRLGFVGNLDWWPNAEALRWYLSEVHPHHGLELCVVGAGDTSWLDGMPRVRVLGFIPDIRDVWTAFDVMLAPVLSGSGVSIKTAEALYNGKPVVATPTGARGLPASDTIRGLTIRQGAADWIATIAAIADGDLPPSPDNDTRALFRMPV